MKKIPTGLLLYFVFSAASNGFPDARAADRYFVRLYGVSDAAYVLLDNKGPAGYSPGNLDAYFKNSTTWVTLQRGDAVSEIEREITAYLDSGLHTLRIMLLDFPRGSSVGNRETNSLHMVFRKNDQVLHEEHYTRPSSAPEYGTWELVYDKTFPFEVGNANWTPPPVENQLGNRRDTAYPNDPVHPATGNYIFSKTLFVLPARSLPVTFEVFYNSRDNGYDGPLGYGWTHTYNIRLTASGTNVTIKWGDGHTEAFRDGGAGSYEPFNNSTRIALKKNSAGTFEATQYNGVKYLFDGQGRLARLLDTNSNSVTLTHTANLDRILDAAGREIRFAYSGNRIESITLAPTGDSVQFQHDARGDLVSLTDFKGNAWRCAYDDAHRMRTLADPRGAAVATNAYDDQGRITRQSNALGQAASFEYLDQGTPQARTKVTLPGGSVSYYHYDQAYNLTKIVDGKGNEAAFGYDMAGNRTATQDKKGGRATVTFDAKGNPVSVTDRLNATTSLAYGINNRLTRVQDSLGNVTQFDYDPQGALSRIVHALGGVTSIERNAAGQVTVVRDPLGHRWQLSYDAQGLVNGVQDPLNHAATMKYDALGRIAELTLPAAAAPLHFDYDKNGNLTKFTDAAGNSTEYAFDANRNVVSHKNAASGATTAYAYNALNQLTKVTDPLGGESTFEYDSAGSLARITDPDGVKAGFSYDASGLLVRREGADGQATKFSYDGNGNLVRRENPLGNAWLYRYDAENRLVAAEDPVGGSAGIAYDSMGQATTVTNKSGAPLRREYDALGRITKAIGADGGAVLYGYDLNGNLTSLRDARGHAWAFAYDALNRLTGKKDPLGMEETYQYYANGRASGIRRRDGKSVALEYGRDGRLGRKTLPDGSAIQYGYDGAGNLRTIQDARGVTTLAHDLLGRRISSTDPHGNTIRYEYTRGGRLAAVIYPGDKRVGYSYDALGRLETIADWRGNRTSYEYDVLSRPIVRILPNKTKKLYSYDAGNRLAGVDHVRADGSVLFSYRISRDKTGNVTHVAESAAEVPVDLQPADATFTYDPANRLVAQSAQGSGVAYTHDANGNMLSRADGGDTTVFAYGPANRLQGTDSGSVSVSYRYDPRGQRIAKTVNGVETRFLMDHGTIFCKLDGANSVRSYYVYAGSILLYRLDEDGSLYVYHGDLSGSVAGITDAGQELLRSYRYSPYGRVIGSAGQLENEFRFVGTRGVMTDENGLAYMRARYYDPRTLRFIQEDPLGLSAGLNLYQYAGGNPVNRIDPSGLDGEEVLESAGCPSGKEKVLDEIYDLLKGIEKEAPDVVDLVDDKLDEMAEMALEVYQNTGDLREAEAAIFTKVNKLVGQWTVNPYKLSTLITDYMAAGLEAGNTTLPFIRKNIESVRTTLVYASNAAGPFVKPLKKFGKFLPVVGILISVTGVAMANDEVERGNAGVELVFGEIPGGDVGLFIGSVIRLIPGVDEGIVDFAQGGFYYIDNTVNLSKYYHQKYQYAYDISGDMDRKIMLMEENMPLDAILSLTCPLYP